MDMGIVCQVSNGVTVGSHLRLSLKLSYEKGEEICRVNKISVPLD